MLSSKPVNPAIGRLQGLLILDLLSWDRAHCYPKWISGCHRILGHGYYCCLCRQTDLIVANHGRKQKDSMAFLLRMPKDLEQDLFAQASASLLMERRTWMNRTFCICWVSSWHRFKICWSGKLVVVRLWTIKLMMIAESPITVAMRMPRIWSWMRPWYRARASALLLEMEPKPHS